MAYSRVAWNEDGNQFEMTIPTIWVQKKTVRWPITSNVERLILSKAQPQSKWLAFDLIKIKHTSGEKLLVLFVGMVGLWKRIIFQLTNNN